MGGLHHHGHVVAVPAAATRPTNPATSSSACSIETRAKGGNLLLNVGPKPDGELPIEQEERLREIAIWMFVNGESIYGVRPWVAHQREEHLVHQAEGRGHALRDRQAEPWQRGDWKDLVRPLRPLDRPHGRQRARPERPRLRVHARPSPRPRGSRSPTACTSAPSSPSVSRTTAAGRIPSSSRSPTCSPR